MAYDRLTFAVALLWHGVTDAGDVVLLAFAITLLLGARCSATWRARLLTLSAYLYLVPMHSSWPTYAVAGFSAWGWAWFAIVRPHRLKSRGALAVGHLLLRSARQLLFRVAFTTGCLLPG